MIRFNGILAAIRMFALIVALSLVSWTAPLGVRNAAAFSAPESFSQLAEAAKPGW
ncbi:hypothetical protein [Desulfosarcina cetonica]|uniref:hypothetical protein n=1 Tax=Desulfosarcina cetonica TaxID=90730 RepID=UPI0012EE35BC|nr:hypothetical protein [Desulfosarcina cetonica]